MKYFIPSWYQNGTWWSDSAEPFYKKSSVSEFDDTVSLINMYEKNEHAYKIMCLNYSSNFRMFLYRNNLYNASYWSVFDDLQGFKDTTPIPLDYRDFDWPTGTEFVYTPYLITCITDVDKKSTIHFSEEGYLMWIENYINNVKSERYIFDDRGILSSIMYFDEVGEASELSYMTINGDYILKENLKTQTVTVNPIYSYRFNKTDYGDMKELIKEQVSMYLTNYIDEKDRFIVASDERHNRLIASVIPKYQLCFTTFSERNNLSEEIEKDVLNYSTNWVVDTLENEKVLTSYIQQQKMNINVMRITPFDAQILPSISNQLYETQIGFYIDGLSVNDINSILNYLVDYSEKNSNSKIILLSRFSQDSWPSAIFEKIEEINGNMGQRTGNEEVITEVVTEEKKLISYNYLPSEADLIKAIPTLRLLIDLNKEPNLFLQISCISAGIPQINCRKTDYVKDKANGMVINDYESMPVALNYFLNHLINWNYSFSYSIQMVDTYSALNIISQLDAFIEGEMNDAKI
ncbi:accessory Sec system protein Asp1 [Staphylococcus shinii]|uniref:accessory Sec system protein Asp1 n=1 Tax=Staphylococcus shinii TaxID=2912228 RepID=UPI003F628172